MRTWMAFALVAAAVVSVAALRQSQNDTATTSALQTLVAQKTRARVRPAVWNDTRKFYELRSGAPAWVRSGQLDRALQILRHAPDHGFTAADYDEPTLTSRAAAVKEGGDAAANLDVDLTTAILSLGRDVAVGRTTPEPLDSRWKARRTVPDLPSTLNDASGRGLDRWLDAVRPSNPQYAASQKALADLYAIQKKGGWSRVPAPALKPGAQGEAVAALRARLKASFDLKNDAAGAGYDADLQDAVRSFQIHHELKPTGIADAPTMTFIESADLPFSWTSR